MEFKKFHLNNIDLKKISALFFVSNKMILKYAFGTEKKKFLKRVEKLIKIGKNHYGHENLYIAYDNSDIAGFFISYTGKEQQTRRKNTDSFTFLKLMAAYGFIKYKLYVRPLFMRISLHNIKNNELYMSEIIVDDRYSDKNVRKFLLDNGIKIAESKRCKKILMDIPIQKEKERKFYEEFGFRTYDKKFEKHKSEEIGYYFLEHVL